MKITPKVEKFCRSIVSGMNQSDAYRSAYNVKNMSNKTIHENASRLMADPKVKARTAEILAPVIRKAQLSREQWIQDALKLYAADPRKLFDKMGNTVPIPELSESEAMALAGFKFKEDFLGVKKSSGEEQAVASGYTQDYKFVDFKTRHEYVGKVLGYYEDGSRDAPPGGLTIILQRDGPIEERKPIDITPKDIQPTGVGSNALPPVEIERG